VSGERRGPRKTLFVVGNRKLTTSDRQSASALSGLPEPSSAVRFMLAHVRVGQLNFLHDQEDFLRAALRLDNISQRDHLTFSTHPARPVSRQDRGSDCGFESNSQFITSLLEPKYGLFCRDRLLCWMKGIVLSEFWESHVRNIPLICLLPITVEH
jgi:hypothetical protein